MTIAADIDAAIDKLSILKGVRLRMGPAAQRALVACGDDDHFTVVGDAVAAYRGIPIEGVLAPHRHTDQPRPHSFNGWELAV